MFGDPALVETALSLAVDLAPGLVYFAIGAGAAVENFFPPMPADTFVVLGGFLSERGQATALGVFPSTWVSNTTGAMLIYGLGRRFGTAFFDTAAGHWLLRPRQLQRLSRLYDAHGFKVIFASRFLPGFRAVVPVFAGVSRLAFWRTAVPLGLASALWYGVLVYLGWMFGRNLDAIFGQLTRVNAVLVLVAGGVALIVAVLWWKTRGLPHSTSRTGGGNA